MNVAFGFIDANARRKLGVALAHHRAKRISIHVAARHADDARVRRNLSVEKPVQQRRKQFAQGKIARRAKHDQIKGRNRNESRHVGIKLVFASPSK